MARVKLYGKDKGTRTRTFGGHQSVPEDQKGLRKFQIGQIESFDNGPLSFPCSFTLAIVLVPRVLKWSSDTAWK